jgi:aminobenzoyl-glutamate utilization protein B
MPTAAAFRRLAAVALILPSCLAASAQMPPHKQRLAEWVDEHRTELTRINRNIWSYAETGLEEVKSSRELQDFLRANGFEVEAGVAGMPTAFVASYGSGKPVIAVLAEYDALPGLSQTSEPVRSPRPDATAGHGCGHSLFGTASTAGAVALRHLMAQENLAGTIRLYGTPAEETLIGKIYMGNAGLFDDVDVVLAWHAADRTRSSYASSKAMVSAKFTFSGLPAHASTSPQRGRSALDAVELMNVGVNYMREHVGEDARIHYVITDGGGQPNVVPGRAQAWYYVRADRHAEMEGYWRRLNDIARGAALMTGTELEVAIDTSGHELLPNLPLSRLIQRNLELVGPPRFDDADREFARRTQEGLTPRPERPLADGIEPLSEEPERGPFSTDIGDISWKVPTGQFNVATYTYGAPGHSWQIVACGAGPIGEKGMLVAAKVMALAAYDLLTDPAELSAARADFEQRTKGTTFTSLVPKGQQAPASIR